MNAHSSDILSLIETLGSNATSGLSEEQAQEKVRKHGENRLREKKKKSNLQRFAAQFKDVMILILLAAAAVSFVIACMEKDPAEFFEPVLILLIVILNAVMQGSKAEKALDALKTLSAPHARVIRDGQERIIDAAGLVPGDVIRLEAGDFVPADARLIRSVSLKSEESALTGERSPLKKTPKQRWPKTPPGGSEQHGVLRLRHYLRHSHRHRDRYRDGYRDGQDRQFAGQRG